jgi:DNA polymerase-3 subunit delta
MLAPCYLVHGGEPFQTEEYIVAIKHLAAKAGYNNSMVFEINAQFDWEELLNKCQTLDLFTEKSVVELRLHGENFSKQGTEILEKLLHEQHGDICILIRAPKLKPQTLNSNWVKLIQKNGKIQVAKPIPSNIWPEWIRQRLQQANLTATPAVIHAIATSYEGSLLAAAQCIDKIKTSFPNEVKLELEQIKPLLQDSSRFSIFELTDAAVSGDVERTFTIFQSLKNEGIEPILILWGVSREIRNLLNLSFEINKGTSLVQCAQQLGIWRDKIPSVKNALQRLSQQKLQKLLQNCSTIDNMLKGIIPGNAWELLLSVYLTLASGKATIMEETPI